MADDFTKIMSGPAMVYVGTANATASTHLGTTDEDGVQLSIKYTVNELRSGSYLEPVKRLNKTGLITIKFTLLEPTTTNLDLVLPSGTCANLMSAATKESSIKIVGTNTDTAASRTITVGRGTFTADFENAFLVGEKWSIPCEWQSLKATADPTLADS